MSIASRPTAQWFAALLLLVVVVSPMQSQAPVRASDPNVNGAVAEQNKLEAELARQRSQLAELQRQQAELAANLRGIKDDLDAVGLEIQQASDEIDAAEQQLDLARRELSTYQDDITNLAQNLRDLANRVQQSKVDLAEREALLQDHLRTAYEQSQTSILEVLLSTDSFTKASSELSYMLTLSDEDRQLASDIRDGRSQLQTRLASLSVGRGTLTELRDEAAARADSIAQQEAELQTARDALQAKQAELELVRDSHESQFVATSQSADAQRQAIARQEQQVAAQAALVAKLKAIADQLDVAYRGRFAWPERGAFVVTQEFGPTPFSSFHPGLDIAYVSGCGGPIYAAGDGIVVEDGRPNAKYGDNAIGVVIAHSQRLATLYWHMSREIVSVGQVVHLGDVIGYEGATGIATGCHLHFEVQFDGSPVNPRKYLP